MGLLDAPATIGSVPNLRQKVYASAALGGGQVASNRIVGPAGSALANTVTTAKIARRMVNGGSALRLVYTNTLKSGTGEDANPSGIHVKAAIEYPAGSIVPVTFGGRPVAHIGSGGFAVSDPIAVTVEPGDVFYERTTVSTPMPPSLAVTGFTTGGNLPAATYFYKVTAVTDAGESNASAEASVTTTGTTGRVVLNIGDKNLTGVDVKRYNVYRSTSTGTELLIGSTPGSQRQYIDNDAITTVTATLTTGIVGGRTATIASTAGIKAGDLITVTGVGDFTVDLVTSDTQIQFTTTLSASSGTTLTLKVQPPSTSYSTPLNGMVFSNLDANEGFLSGGGDLAWAAKGGATYGTTSGTLRAYVATAVLAQPSAARTTVKPPVALLGDSIINGTGWSAITAPYRGFAAYALGEAFPYVNLSTAGESAYQFADSTHSNTRMTVVQHCKYSVSEYGTNDLGRTTAQIQAAMVTIAQRCLRVGVVKHWQTTLLPKAGSTDGWQTYTNQSTGGSEAQRQTINQWLRAPASAGAGNSFLYDVGTAYAPYVGVFDIALVIERNANGTAITLAANGSISNGVGGLWKAYSSGALDSNAGTISGTTTTLTDSGKTWTTNQWAGYMLAVTTSGTTTYVEVATNTATTLTLQSAIPAPISSSTYTIYKGPTIDGTHPTDFTHQEIAAAIDTTKFV